MTLIQLANKALSSHLNQANGYGEKIFYKHTEISESIVDLGTIVEVVCSPQSGNYRHLNDERLKDAMSFMGIFLATAPQKNDLITYNNVEWKVEIFDGINPYNLVAYRKTNTITRKPSR